MRTLAIFQIALTLLTVTAHAQPLNVGAPQANHATISTALNYSALQPGQQAVLAVVVDINKGFHSQSNKPLDKYLIPFTVTIEPNDAVTIYSPIYPEGILHEYPALGKISVYEDRTIVYVPLQVNPTATAGDLKLSAVVRYQICDDKACFPPKTDKLAISTTIVSADTPVQPNQPELFEKFDPRVWSTLKPATQPADNSTRDSGSTIFGFALGNDSYGLAFAGAFVAGIIFNIVPCVLPVLPLKAMGFYEAAQQSRRRCLMLGVAFSIGIISTFTALALPVLVFQTLNWGEMFGNPIFAAVVVIVLLAMAIGQFGFFGVNLPTFVYNFTPRHDTMVGNYLFGILTAILSTPCTFGMFFALLVWAADQPGVVGVGLLNIVGVGMAFPYLVLSAFPNLARKIPRSGQWSEVVKQMMAFLLVATAVFFGNVLLPASLRGPGIWWVIFSCVAASGVFLIVRAIQIAPRVRPILIASIIALLIITPAFGVTLRLANPPMQWIDYTPEILADARASNTRVLVEFTADWCGNCKAIEFSVYTDDTAKRLRSADVIAIKADLSSDSAPGWKLLDELHPVGSIPFTAIYLPGMDSPRGLAGIYSTNDLFRELNVEIVTSTE